MKLRTAILVLMAAMFSAVATSGQQQNTASRDSVASGRELYTQHCASCHGKDGKGNGPAAGALKVHPPDLTTIAKRNGGRFPAGNIYQVIKWGGGIVGHGSKEMPVWGPVFMSEAGRIETESTARIRSVIRHLESLQVK